MFGAGGVGAKLAVEEGWHTAWATPLLGQGGLDHVTTGHPSIHEAMECTLGFAKRSEHIYSFNYSFGILRSGAKASYLQL